MQVSGYHARRGELDFELLWLSITLGGFLFAAFWLAAGLPWPHCLFLALTGHPCVTCGATRSAIQFLHGHFYEAWRWNPLLFAFFCGVALFDAYAVTVLTTGVPRLRVSDVTPGEKKLIRSLVWAALALNWIYLLANSARYA